MRIREGVRQTIEGRGQELAYKQRKRMFNGEDRIYPIVQIKDVDILGFPRLTTGELGNSRRQRFQEDLRYSPFNGEIYTTRWEDVETSIVSIIEREIIKNEDGETTIESVVEKQVIKNAEDFRFIRPKEADSVDPEYLPKSANVKRLVFSQVWDGIETAIRQNDYIRTQQDPGDLLGEPQIIRRMISLLDQVSQKFIEGHVTKDQLKRLSQEVDAKIIEEKLQSAVDPTKQKIVYMSKKATEEDSLGRTNLGKSRMQAAAARLAALRRLNIGIAINQKFSANLSVLVHERWNTRSAMGEAYIELGSIQQYLDRSNISDFERQELASIVDGIAKKYLSYSRVAPYLIPSRLAAIFLVGCRDEKKDINRLVLGAETADEIYSLPSAKELIEGGEFNDAKRYIIWTRDILYEALNNPDHNNLGETKEAA